MTDEFEHITKFELKHRFYYLEFPHKVQTYWWKDGDGKYKLMDDMGLDHLQACARRIEKDLKAFIKSRGDGEVVKILMPVAEEKLKELKEILREKALS